MGTTGLTGAPPHLYRKTCGCKSCCAGRDYMARLQQLKKETESLREQLCTAVTRMLVSGKISGVKAQGWYNTIRDMKGPQVREAALKLGIVPQTFDSKTVPAGPKGVRLVRFE